MASPLSVVFTSPKLTASGRKSKSKRERVRGREGEGEGEGERKRGSERGGEGERVRERAEEDSFALTFASSTFLPTQGICGPRSCARSVLDVHP